jgi:ATP-binding cassette subfamily B protein
LKFPHYKQLDAMDCGPTCLRIIAKYFGKSYSLAYRREHSYITRSGVSLLGISEAAEGTLTELDLKTINKKSLKKFCEIIST